MKLKLIIQFTAVLLAGAFGMAQAATNTASSGSFADVSAAVASASPGDTVVIPPGRNVWTQTLNLSGITLQGAGTNLTFIVDETPASGNGLPVISIGTAPTLTRVTQLTITVGVTNAYPFQKYSGNIDVSGSSPLLRIDHCVFYWLTGKPIHFLGQVNGLVDHCSFQMQANALSIEMEGDGYGDLSWATPYVWGSSNALFIEDNYFSSVWHFSGVDVGHGIRAVIRNNIFQDGFIVAHGTETSQRYRSMRVAEVYNNQFFHPAGWFSTGFELRGGSVLMWSNILSGYKSVATPQSFRATDNDPRFLPWNGATGLCGYDSNSPALLSGTASTTSNILSVAGANWINNQWVGCTVLNTNQKFVTSTWQGAATNIGSIGMVIANNSNTMWFASEVNPGSGLQIKFAAGDPFVVHRVYPQLDQPGMGQGDLLSGDTPAATWSHQASEPIYFWGNLASPNYGGALVQQDIFSSYPNVQAGRDFFNASKPGYVPYVYPHPLTIDTTPLIGNTNNVSNGTKPAPPSSLSTHPPGQ